MNILDALSYALIGGLVPSLIWLWFWLHEDRLHPEPRKLILKAFAYGMLAVPIVLLLERLISCLGSVNCSAGITSNSFLLLLGFAVVEELFKYWAAHLSCLKTSFNDEPIDPVIYLISAALGFAALENAFFLLQPFLSNEIFRGVITDNLRFIGANLLHVISSATVGIFIAFSYYKKKRLKRLYLLVGLVFAIILHVLFNFSIINDAGHNLILIFGFVWLSVIILILVFEKVKNIKKTS